MTQGIGESFLAEKIKKWEAGLPKKGIKLAYLPAQGKVRLRLSATGKNKTLLEKTIEKAVKDLYKIAAEYIYGEDVFGKTSPTQEAL